MITLFIDPEVAAEMGYLSRECKNEVGGLLGVIGVKKNILYCNNIISIPGEHTSASFEINGDDISKIMLNNFDNGTAFPINGWWHSHANMDVFLSMTDDSTIEMLKKYSDIIVSIVTNNKNEIFVDIDTAIGKIEKKAIKVIIAKP